MLFRKAALILTIIFVLATIGLALWFWKSHNALYSSPTTIRTNDSYLRAHAPSTNVPPLPTNLFSSITIKQSTNQIDIWAPESFTPRFDQDYGPLEIHHADSSQSVALGTGSVRLAYISSAYATFKTNLEWGMEIPANFYTADLRPITGGALPGIIPKHERKVHFYGDFPAARFFFVSSNLPHFKLLKFGAYDARTHQLLTQGHSSSVQGNLFWYGTSVALWHQTPIEIIVTIAAGPPQTYTMPATVGSELEYPGGVIRFLASSPVEFGGTSTRSDGRTNHITLTASASNYTPSDQRPRSSLLFYLWPDSTLHGNLEYFGHNGQKIETYGGGTSSGINHVRIFARPEDLEEIRFTYYPQAYRLNFTIPELPGLPEQNRNLENLFDVHIPYMQFRYEYAFQENVTKIVQMRHSYLPLTFPNSYFPTFRTNTTARELFLELGSLLSDPTKQLIADPRENVIEARPHPVRALYEKFKKKVGLGP
jgi:hypothetical protein